MTVHIIHDLIHSYIVILEGCEDISNCEHVYYYFVQMVSDEETTKIKDVDLDNLENFIFGDLFN